MYGKIISNGLQKFFWVNHTTAELISWINIIYLFDSCHIFFIETCELFNLMLEFLQNFYAFKTHFFLLFSQFEYFYFHF